VGTSICGKGAIAEDHPLSIGVVGGNGGRPYANSLVRAADAILYVGCKTDSVTTDGWSIPALSAAQTILHLDVDPTEVGRNYRTAVGLVGDARLGLADLLAAGPGAKRLVPAPILSIDIWHDCLRAFWAEFEAKAALTTTPIKPQRVIDALARLLPADSVVIADAGTPTPFTAAYLRSPAGRQVIIPRGYGGLGYAIPGVIGSQTGLASGDGGGPDGRWKFRHERWRTGDGGAAGPAGDRLSSSTMPVSAGSRPVRSCSTDGRCFGVDFSADTDYAGIARGFGLRGVRVEDPREVEPALREALAADRPTFIDVVTEPETTELPPVEKWQSAVKREKGG
jgi:acetolactate synthase-1/2/3 large subunit